MLIKVVPRGCVSLIWAGVSIVLFRRRPGRKVGLGAPCQLT
jgi:hypothetical protein